MSRGVAVLAIAIAAGIAVVQSTVLGFASIAGVHPDLVLIVVVYAANKNGTMIGQLAGLGAGVVLDLMGLAPLGLYALIFTVVGALFGLTKGKMFVDPIFMPLFFAIVALLLKGMLGAGLAGLYGIEGVVTKVFSMSFLIELGYTAVVSPMLFGLLKLIGPLRPDRRRGEGL